MPRENKTTRGGETQGREVARARPRHRQGRPEWQGGVPPFQKITGSGGVVKLFTDHNLAHPTLHCTCFLATCPPSFFPCHLPLSSVLSLAATCTFILSSYPFFPKIFNSVSKSFSSVPNFVPNTGILPSLSPSSFSLTFLPLALSWVFPMSHSRPLTSLSHSQFAVLEN